MTSGSPAQGADIGVSDLNSVMAARVREWIQEKWSNEECPMCDVDAWTVGAPAQIQVYWDTEGESPRRHTPLVQLWCSNCGYTILLHSKLIGIPTAQLQQWIDARFEVGAESSKNDTGEEAS